MISCSTFKHTWTKSQFNHKVPVSEEYKVFINGEEVPVYTCRISAYPFNIWWPGHQRPVDQTEIASYVNLVSDEEVKIEVVPTNKEYKKIMLKPYSKEVKTQVVDGTISFTLKENGGYVLELDSYHNCLYIFNNKPVPCENPENVTYYFGAGVHMPGKIVLKSNESVYLEKDALVYGCILAENAENIHVYGNGIFDDSGEERFDENCYEPFANGNIKFYDCKNIRLEGVGFMNSAIWCVNLFHCFDVEINGINVFGQWRYNTDGVDIVNSQRVVIRNSFIHSFDDTITIKGIDRYAHESNCDMLFENCVLWCDWGKTCEIGLETACREYKNITFRNCDILRAGNTACDIQNGDYAEVHDITFENIRVELESFYTPPMLEQNPITKRVGIAAEMEYNRKDEIEIANIVNIVNSRFRDAYAFLDIKEVDSEIKPGDKRYAGVSNIKIKDVHVYADEKIIEMEGTNCVRVHAKKYVSTSEFSNITVENVTLNGKKLSKEEMKVVLNENEDSFRFL